MAALDRAEGTARGPDSIMVSATAFIDPVLAE
jgi:hypothetical protein